jgi:AraC family transcriptional regulator, ethanolamine operon transcriptional activator
MDLRVDQFEDVHLHAASVHAWEQTYSQITPGPVRSSLCQIAGARFQFFRERINQRLVQHGQAPRDRVCFALPLAVPGTARLQGREADERSILILGGGDEFLFHMPQGMDMIAITFDRDTFEGALEASPWSGDYRQWLRQPVARVPERRLAQCRERLLFLLGRSIDDVKGAAPGQAEEELERDLLEEITCLLAHPEFDRNQRLPSSPGSYVVDRCHQMTLSARQSPPSVIDLCERLRISRRTVQNSFRAVTETTPVNYIRCIRLNGVRRELLGSHAGELSIGDAAGRWGFFHLSHFAADYQALFGELPSQTRRAGPRAAWADAA